MKRKINLIVAVLLVVAICATMVPVNSEALTYSGSSSYMSGKYYKRLTGVTLTGNQRTDIVNMPNLKSDTRRAVLQVNSPVRLQAVITILSMVDGLALTSANHGTAEHSGAQCSYLGAQRLQV